MGTEKTRKMILEKLKNTFIKTGFRQESINKNKLVSELCMLHGCTKKKALEYVQVLLDAEFIREDEFGLWFNPLNQQSILEIDEAVKSEPAK